MTLPDTSQVIADLAGPDAAAAVACLAALPDKASVLSALAEETEQLAISDVNAALAAAGELVKVADAARAPAQRARLRRALGHAMAYANRFTDAIAVLDEGMHIAEAGGERLEAARVGVAKLHALARLGRLNEAAEVGIRAHASLVSLGERVLAAKAAANLGVVHRMLDEPAAALDLFDRALPFLAENPVNAAQIQSNRGEALLDLCEFAGAEAAFASALTVFEGAGATRAASIVQGNLADLLSRQGRLGEALHHFQGARRRMEADAAGDAARLRIEEAEAQLAVGLLVESAAGYKQSIPVLDGCGMASEAARARLGFGRVLGIMGNLPAAAGQVQEAVDRFRAIGQTVAAARATLALGQLRFMEGDGAAGTALVHAGMLELRDRPADLAAAHALLANASLSSRNAHGALVEASAGLDLAQSAGLVHLVPVLRHLRGRALRERNLLGSAAAELETAAMEVDQLRGTLQLDRFRAAFASTHASLFQDAVAAVIAENSSRAVDRAFDIVQRAKSGSLLDLLSAPSSGDRGAVTRPDRALVAEMSAARARLRALVQRVQDLGAASTASRLDLADQISRTEHETDRLEARLSVDSPYRQLVGGAERQEAIRAGLPAGWAVVEYFGAGSELLAFVLHDGGLRCCRLGPVAPVIEEIDRLRFQISKALTRVAAGADAGPPAGMNSTLGALYRSLISPLESALPGITGLAVCPTGPLHAVPFHALHSGEAYLTQRLCVLQAPSASIMARLSGVYRPFGAGRGALVVGVPDELAPGVSDEVAALASILPGADSLIGDDATLARVRDLCAGRPLVHLACHGAFRPDAVSASGLKLADGWLSAREAAGFPLSGAVVTLSGCDTGRVVIGAGDELVGLQRALLGAGALGVFGSLWPVHDKEATRFLVNLYRKWYVEHETGGNGLARAAGLTRQESIAAGVHPVFWAPFFVVGAP